MHKIFKLDQLIVCQTFLLLAISLGILFYFSHKVLLKEAMRDAELTLEGTAQTIDNILMDVEQSTGNIYHELMEHLDEPDRMYVYCRELVESNPNIVGCAIAFKPGYYPGKDLFMTYVHRRAFSSDIKSDLVTTDTFTDRTYTEQAWYKDPMNKGWIGWTDPLKGEDTENELSMLENADESLEELNAQMSELLKTVTIKANLLSEHRMKAAERFTKQVAGELEFLNMPDVKLDVRNEKGKLTVNGMDNIEFLISANAGEEPKPIAKIASGGELSRIMLALKNVIAEKDDIETLIFDEIDTGVSGRAAEKIGIKLRQISKLRQVLCVTHLSQIAVMADEHLLIEKRVEDGRTKTSVRPLDHEGRKRELARIMGGENITELMLENADQYLKEAAKL